MYKNLFKSEVIHNSAIFFVASTLILYAFFISDFTAASPTIAAACIKLNLPLLIQGLQSFHFDSDQHLILL